MAAVSPLIRNPWAPVGTTNGWYPKLSPDGAHVAYGNGDVWITNLETGVEHFIGAGVGVPMGWIDSDTLYGVLNTDTSSQMWQVVVGTWTAENLSIDASLSRGNTCVAVEDHWATWLFSEARVIRDGALVRAGDAYGLSLSPGGDYLLTSRGSDWALQVYKAGAFVRTVVPQSPVLASSVSAAGHVAYLGATGIFVADPSGSQHRVSAPVAGVWEGLGPLVEDAAGTMWLFTAGGDPAGPNYTLWARRADDTDPAPAVSADLAGPLYLDVVAASAGGWIVAGQTDVGVLSVIWTAGGTATSRIPTDLTARDAGFLLGVLDYGHLLRWSGTAWDFAPGDGGNGYVVQAATMPAAAGWALCDGKATSVLKVGTRVTAKKVTTPKIANVTSGTTTLKSWYRK